MPLIYCLIIAMAGLQARGAATGDPGSRRGSISGTVIRAGAAALALPDGLGDVRVVLKPGNAEVWTRPSGAFVFANLAPGSYTISFARDGYIPQEDRQHGITPSGMTITLLPGQALKNIKLPMIPGPVLAGRVFNPHGKPSPAALVRVYRRQYTPLGTRLRTVSKGMTNDLGEFRLFGLNFGEYFLSAGYSDRDRGAALGATRLAANVTKADDGYPTVFYDGAEDLTHALAARLAPGADPGEINIYINDTPRYHIRGLVLPPVGGTQIMLFRQGSDLSEAEYRTAPDRNGSFEVSGLAPGLYGLFATAGGGEWASEVVALNLADRDLEGVRLTLEPTITVNGSIELTGLTSSDAMSRLRNNLYGSFNFSATRVSLIQSDVEFEQTIQTYANPDGTFTLQHVPTRLPFDIAIEGLPDAAYVRNITSGSASMLMGRSRLLPDQPLKISLAVATDSLDIHVSKGGDPAAGAQIVLIPAQGLRRRADRYITGYTDVGGELHLDAVPPGSYTAYAFENIEPGAYYAIAYKPGSDAPFKDYAQPVVVGEGGTKRIELKLVSVAQTAGLQ